MNFGKFITLELRRNLISLTLLLSIGLSLALGGGIIYATHQYDGPFQLITYLDCTRRLRQQRLGFIV